MNSNIPKNNKKEKHQEKKKKIMEINGQTRTQEFLRSFKQKTIARTFSRSYVTGSFQEIISSLLALPHYYCFFRPRISSYLFCFMFSFFIIIFWWSLCIQFDLRIFYYYFFFLSVIFFILYLLIFFFFVHFFLSFLLFMVLQSVIFFYLSLSFFH